MTNLGVAKDKKDPDLLHHVIVEFASESAVGSVLRTSLDTDLVKLCLSVIHDPEEQLEELVRLTYSGNGWFGHRKTCVLARPL